MRRHLIIWPVALLMGLVLTSAVEAQPGPSAREVLRLAAERSDDIPHEGRLTTTIQDRNRSPHRYRKHLYAGHEGCQVSEQSGSGAFGDQSVICDGQRRWRVFRGGKLALVSAPMDFAAERDERVARARHGLDGYDARRLPDQTIAGRLAWLVEISRVRNGRSVRVRALAVDHETYLQLGNVTYNQDGDEVSRTIYDEVRYLSDDEIDVSRFQYVPGADTLVLPEPGRIEIPVLFRDAQARADWIVPLRKRPRGWRPGGVALPPFGDRIVAQFYYVDERDGQCSRPVYLYEHPRGQRRTFFDDFYELDSVGAEPQPREQAAVWCDDDLVYVLTSTLPVEELLAAARNHVEAHR
jgi:hypothetical protein